MDLTQVSFGTSIEGTDYGCGFMAGNNLDFPQNNGEHFSLIGAISNLDSGVCNIVMQITRASRNGFSRSPYLQIEVKLEDQSREGSDEDASSEDSSEGDRGGDDRGGEGGGER